MAIRISEETGAGLEWLLANDHGREIENIAGESWSEKDRQKFDAGRERWFKLDLSARNLRLETCDLLLGQYLQLRALLESFPEPGDASDALYDWSDAHKRSVDKLLKSYRAIGVAIPQPSCVTTEKNLRSIRADIDAVLRSRQK